MNEKQLIGRVHGFIINKRRVTLKEIYEHFKNERESSLRVALYVLQKDHCIEKIDEWRAI